MVSAEIFLLQALPFPSPPPPPPPPPPPRSQLESIWNHLVDEHNLNTDSLFVI